VKGAPLLWPLALVGLGVILLLNNFLLLSGFNAAALWPLLLVVAGAQILLRGDIAPAADARTFAITRGSVESGTLEINAGEIDVHVRGLQREGRLIAGQYALDSRPYLNVVENHAHLKMSRAATPWLSFADWEMGVAADLPWQVLVSTSLGQVQLDLTDVIVHEVVVGTGIGDIRMVCPKEAFSPLRLRSAVGNIHIITPPGCRTRVTVQGSPVFRVHADDQRYEQFEDGVYLATDVAADSPLVEIQVSGTFGDAYLA
jgi:cell wall-active antibiotic response 4TMS protein YvqF